MPSRTPKTKKLSVASSLLPPTNPLGVPHIRQEQIQWCWAACADMVLEFYRMPNVDQCDLANTAFPQAGGACCNAPSSSLCNKPLYDAEISKLWKAKDIESSYVHGSVPFAILQREINEGRPVEVAFTRSGGGHVVIVEGWSESALGQYLFVNDPAKGAGQKLISYEHLLSANGRWDATWTGLRK